jgi:N-carbamoyl-L-amino-acid hydrolase
MLLIRNEGGSHNPDEQMEFDDFAVGTRLMARALAHIA